MKRADFISEFIKAYFKEYAKFQDTLHTWPYKIESLAGIPDSYKSVFPSSKGSFPYTILIPDENNRFSRKKGFLISIIGDTLHIFDKLGSHVNSASFHKKDMLYLVSGTELLYSWIAVADDKKTCIFPYNSVMDYLFFPIIDKFRNIEHILKIPEKSAKQYLPYEYDDIQLKRNIKFRNLLYNPFLKTQIIKKLIFQPACLFRYKQFPLFKFRFFKKYISNHLALLTDKELVFIQERDIIQKKLRKNYNYIFTFININNIKKCETRYEQENNIRKLIIILKNRATLTTYFSMENQNFDPFIDELNKAIKK